MTKPINTDISLTDEKIKTIFREAKKGNEQAQFFINRLGKSDLVIKGAETLGEQFARVHEEVKKEEN